MGYHERRRAIVCSAPAMNRSLSASGRATVQFLRRHFVLFAIAACYLYCFPYFAKLRHANELPRILTTLELAEHGSFRLDSRLDELGSRADISTTPSGAHYQNKAPGLSLLALPVYYPLHLAYRAAGLRPPMMLSTWIFRSLVITVPALAFLGAFRRVAARFTSDETAQNAALVAYALGSMVLPFGILFMSHVLATVLVGFAFAVAFSATREQRYREPRAALGVGALLGLSMLVEYQALFAALLIAGYFVWGAERRLHTLLLISVAVLPFIGGLAAYHAAAFGSPLRTGYAYSVDPTNRVGILGIVGPSQESLAQLFVRVSNGLLLLSPWVVLSLAGLVRIARDSEARARVGREAVLAGLVMLVYVGFVASLHPSFGRAGWSVGPRYVMIAMPFVAWLSAAGLDLCLRYTPLRVPALAFVLTGVAIHVLATTTYPHWPSEFENPLYEISLLLLKEGHAPHSLGTLVGLRGTLSLLPLYLGVSALVLYLLASTRKYLLELGLAVLLAGFAVARYDRLGVTPPHAGNATRDFVLSTLEP